jgi:hypothetical protein
VPNISQDISDSFLHVCLGKTRRCIKVYIGINTNTIALPFSPHPLATNPHIGQFPINACVASPPPPVAVDPVVLSQWTRKTTA